MMKIKERITSQAGETIAEVLISLLIATVALMMLAMMISSTVSMVTRSKDRMDEYYSGNADLELQEPSSSRSITITIETSGSAGTTVKETPNVALYENTTLNNPVYAYQIKRNESGNG